jgi:hypothetical protein
MRFDEGLQSALNLQQHALVLRDLHSPVFEHETAGHRPAFDRDRRKPELHVAHVLADPGFRHAGPARIDRLGIEPQIGSQAIVHHDRELGVEDLVDLIVAQAAEWRTGVAQNRVAVFVLEYEVPIVLG